MLIIVYYDMIIMKMNQDKQILNLLFLIQIMKIIMVLIILLFF
jgi:hypothetical protein